MVCLLNRAYGIFSVGGNRCDLDAVLKEMIDYIGSHTATEEFWMLRHRYPGIVVHAEQHRELKQKIDTFQQQAQEMRTDVAVRLFSFELFSFLKDWLVDHVLTSDRHFGDYLTTSGLNQLLPANVDSASLCALEV